MVLTHFPHHFGCLNISQKVYMCFFSVNSLISQSYDCGKKYNFLTPNHPMCFFLLLCCPALSEFGTPQLGQFWLKQKNSTTNALCGIQGNPNGPSCVLKLLIHHRAVHRKIVWTSPLICAFNPMCVSFCGCLVLSGHHNSANSGPNNKIQPPMPRVAFKEIPMVPHVCQNTWFITAPPSTNIRVDIPHSYVHFVLNKIPEHSLHFFCPKLVRGNYLCGLFPPFACHSTNSFFWTK